MFMRRHGQGRNAAYWKVRNEVTGGARRRRQKRSRRRGTWSSYQPDFIPAKRYTGMRAAPVQALPGLGYYKSASAPARPRDAALSAERKAMRDGLAAFAADNSARSPRRDPRRVLPVDAIGNARYLTNGASDGADELLSEARKDATPRARDALRRDAHQPRRHRREAQADGVGRRVYKLGKPRQPVGHPGLYAVFRQGAEAARAADGDGRRGKSGPRRPRRPTPRIARRTASAAALVTRARREGTERTTPRSCVRRLRARRAGPWSRATGKASRARPRAP